MTNTTWTKAPADLLGLGSSAVHRCAGYDGRTLIGVSPAPRITPVQGTAVPVGSTAVWLRPAFQARPEVQVSARNAFAHNSIGTTLGNQSSRRPQS